MPRPPGRARRAHRPVCSQGRFKSASRPKVARHPDPARIWTWVGTSSFGQASLDDFRRQARLNVEALNFAAGDIPPEQLRMHLCWGNYEGPYDREVPLRDIIDIVLSARPSAISLEACNPRHAHEWQVFEDVKLPEGKLLLPGVIDSTTNDIEHPDLVAQGIQRYAKAVGREKVMAGIDCGFGTFAGVSTVDPDITGQKFRSMAEGARIVSERLWTASLRSPEVCPATAGGGFRQR